MLVFDNVFVLFFLCILKTVSCVLLEKLFGTYRVLHFSLK